MPSRPLHIVVAVKHVPDAGAERSFRDDFTVDRDAGTGRLSELDEYAVEEALSLVERAGGGSVTAVTIWPEAAAEAVKKALQMGADTGVHVCDPAIAGSDAPATSAILAAAVNRVNAEDAQTPVDLVLCGMASTDGTMSVLPAMLADRLEWPHATRGHRAAVADDAGTVARDTETASLTVRAPLPAVVSVTDRTNQPRYPSLRSIMAARKKPVTTYTLADLGVDPATVGLGAALTTVLEVTPRPPRQAGRKVTDDGNGGKALVDFLVEQKIL
jgi:electron transfer flavoprotein beta subunit